MTLLVNTIILYDAHGIRNLLLNLTFSARPSRRCEDLAVACLSINQVVGDLNLPVSNL